MSFRIHPTLSSPFAVIKGNRGYVILKSSRFMSFCTHVIYIAMSSVLLKGNRQIRSQCEYYSLQNHNLSLSSILVEYLKSCPGLQFFRNGKQEKEGMRIYFFFFLAVFFLADFRTIGAGDFFCTI